MLLTLSAHILFRLLALAACLCALVPAFGARPMSEHEAWHRFGFDACVLPCYAGITPGRSGFGSSASTLLREVPAIDPRMISTGTSLSFWARMPSQQLSGIIRYEQGGGVGEIRLNALLPVEQVIAQLGTPDCILTRANSSQTSVIFWERGAVSVGAVLENSASTLRLNANVLALWLRAATPPDCDLRGALTWHGFAPLWVYGDSGS